MIEDESMEWRAVPWAPAYQVSSMGRIRRRINVHHPKRRQWVALRLDTSRDGHKVVAISSKRQMVHRLVYSLFVGELLPGLVVCHLDGNPANNDAANLLQATQAENMNHKIAHGTHQVGQKHGRALYSDATIARVRDALNAAPKSATGRVKRGTLQKISADFQVSYHVVADVAAGKSWRHV